MRARAGLLAVLAAMTIGGALVFAACGGDDDDAADTAEEIRDSIESGNADDDGGDDGGDLPDPCELVDAEDAGGLFGSAAEQAENSSPVDLGATCLWQNTGGDELGTVGHLLQVHVYDGQQFFSKTLFPDAEAVEGLGDDSFVNTGESALQGVDIQFLHDDLVVALSYTTINIGVENEADKVNAADHADDVVAIAKQAEGRL